MKSGIWLASLAALTLAAACGGETAPAAPGEPAPEAAAAPATVAGLEKAVAGDWRLESERARDAYRHPVETLTFFGLKPTDTVVEIAPGGGWYTAILAPYLKEGGGKLYAAGADPATSEGAQNYINAFSDKERYGDITFTIASRNGPGIAPDGSADVVLTFRNIHNWMSGGYADKIFADAYRALKPGGVLGVEEHRLPSARDQDLRATNGYVLESYVVQLAQNAGFQLEESSEINANPKDNADHPLGVWMLPPTLDKPQPGTPEAEGYDQAKYIAIGESDRMTLRFRKPANAPAPAQPTHATPPAQ